MNHRIVSLENLINKLLFYNISVDKEIDVFDTHTDTCVTMYTN